MNRPVADSERVSGETAAAADGSKGHPPRYLFPVDGDHSTKVLRLVCNLVADTDAELVIASPVTVPEQTPLEHPDPTREGQRRVAEFVWKTQNQCAIDPVESVVRVGHNRGDILEDIVDAYSISLLITDSV